MRNSEAGVTVYEVTLVLVVTMVMVAALSPAVSAMVAKTQSTRATTDMNTLVTTMTNFLSETGCSRFSINGACGGTQVELLVSDGDIPATCTAASGCGTGTNQWQRTVDNTGGLTDFLERHLVTNNPRGSSANDYAAGAGAWRGPYLNAPINPDPWGNRYMVNAAFFNVFPTDVDILSAGPDGAIDTIFSGSPLAAGNDDLVVLVEN